MNQSKSSPATVGKIAGSSTHVTKSKVDADDKKCFNERDNGKETVELLKPVNKLKYGNFSSSSFRKALCNCNIFFPLFNVVVPMFTWFGPMTLEQMFMFGVCHDLFEETDKNRSKLTTAMKKACDQEIVAKYQYKNDGKEITAYLLTESCYAAIKKDISLGRQKKFWGQQFGKNSFFSVGDIERDKLDRHIRVIDRFINYLYAVKDLFSETVYNSILKSVNCSFGEYNVSVFHKEKCFCCRFALELSEISDCGVENILVFDNVSADSLPEDSSLKNVFVFFQNDLKHYEHKDGSYILVSSDDDEYREIQQQDETVVDCGTEKNAGESELERQMSASVSAAGKKKTENEKTEVETGSGVRIQLSENDPATETNAENELSILVKSKKVPSDETFCQVMNSLLQEPYQTKNSLSQIIVQTVLLADGAALESDRPLTKKLSLQIKLATHLMLDDQHSYSSQTLSSAFDDPDNDNKALMLSSYLFAMLTPSVAFDYGLKDQTDMFLSEFMNYFSNYVPFKKLFSKFIEIRDYSSTGFSPTVVALLGTEEEYEEYMRTLSREAMTHLTFQTPHRSMRTLPLLYNLLFGKNSDFYTSMEMIANNQRDDESIGLIHEILVDYCDESTGEYDIKDYKIDTKLTEGWGKVNPKNNFKLEYIARQQVIRQITIRLNLMIRWVDQINSRNSKQKNIQKLRSIKTEILEQIKLIIQDNSWKKDRYANVLLWMLLYAKNYISGRHSNLEIYSSLLCTGIVSLNEDGTPYVDHSMREVKYYEPWRNAIRHILCKNKPLVLEQAASEILGSNLSVSADYSMKDNLHQLHMIGLALGSRDDVYEISETQIREARELADARKTKFEEILELAYTYNRIDEIAKENLLGIMTQYKDDFYERKEFGSWGRLLRALETQIEEYEEVRKADLKPKLEQHLLSDPDSVLLKEAKRLLEVDRNFAVTEEYLNRYDAGFHELVPGLDQMHETSYFREFLGDDVYVPFYQECIRNKDKTLRKYAWDFLQHRIPTDWPNSEKESLKKVINCWPSRNVPTQAEHISSFFSFLGFNVQKCIRVNNTTIELFQLTVVAESRSRADYQHPIAFFGTQMKSPVNVVVLGKQHTEKELVDKITNLDLRRISIVLIDRAIDSASRRLIGELYHKTTRQNNFLLIDQVLFMYLATLGGTERLPALLQCTLPYTFYQPFVRDGGSTADEMFFGRIKELDAIIDMNGACVVYGGRQLGKTALLERAESRCNRPADNVYAIYTSIVRIRSESEVVSTLIANISKKTGGMIELRNCDDLLSMCKQLKTAIRKKSISLYLFIDEVDDFLDAISATKYIQLQPLVDLWRDRKNNFKFVIAGLHNVCRAKNAVAENGIFGQLGTPLCIKPLSPTDALNLLSRPLHYLGFQVDRYPHMETILTNTNYYPGILQFFGYNLVGTISDHYSKYYRAANGNPPFTLQDEQLGAVMNSSDLNRSIKDKFRLTLELDQRYFMIARCITLLYHLEEDSMTSGSWLGFSINSIMEVAKTYDIHCLKNETEETYINLLEEMKDMGILSQPKDNVRMYRLRRKSFVDIIGENIDDLEREIISKNEELQ